MIRRTPALAYGKAAQPTRMAWAAVNGCILNAHWACHKEKGVDLQCLPSGG